MAYTKTEAFEIQEQQLAKIAKALAHPARLSILKLLFEKGLCICGDIVEELPLSQSTVSQHLKELKSAGLITGEIDGPRVSYCIDIDKWNQAKKYFRDFFSLDQGNTHSI